MTENVKKIFEILGIEPNEKFKVGGLVYGNIFTIDENLIISDDSETIHIYLLTSLLTGDCKIIKLPKEPKKKKLRDLTKEEYKKWLEKNCKNNICDKCIFNNVVCSDADCSWVNHKYLYSDAFLNKEIEVEE